MKQLITTLMEYNPLALVLQLEETSGGSIIVKKVEITVERIKDDGNKHDDHSTDITSELSAQDITDLESCVATAVTAVKSRDNVN